MGLCTGKGEITTEAAGAFELHLCLQQPPRGLSVAFFCHHFRQWQPNCEACFSFACCQTSYGMAPSLAMFRTEEFVPGTESLPDFRCTKDVQRLSAIVASAFNALQGQAQLLSLQLFELSGVISQRPWPRQQFDDNPLARVIISQRPIADFARILCIWIG